MITEKHLIVMTATVYPQVAHRIVRVNPETRLSDYCKSIESIFNRIERHNIDLCVVENSGSINIIRDSLSAKIKNSKKIFFVQCPKDSLSIVGGISSGEHKMLEFIAKKFDLKGYEVIWKLTGRLCIDNLIQIISKSRGDFRANSFFTNHHSVDSRFFGMSKDCFVSFAINVPEYNLNLTKSLKSNELETFESIEYFLSYFALRVEFAGLNYQSLPEIPIYRGVSGSTGKALDGGRTIFATKLANLFRRLLIKGLLGINP